MQSTDTRDQAQAIPATLANLDRLWTIAVGSTHHQRLIGGITGRRFATDGGALVLISDQEFASGGYAWSRPVGLASDMWSIKSAQDAYTARALGNPDDLRPLMHGLGMRFGATWISGLYVDIFLRLGATTIRLADDPKSPAVVPELGVIAPCDPAAFGQWGVS